MKTQESIIKEINERKYISKHTWAEIKEQWGQNGMISVEGSMYESLKEFFEAGNEIHDSDVFGLIQEHADMDRLILLHQDIRCDICYGAC